MNVMCNCTFHIIQKMTMHGALNHKLSIEYSKCLNDSMSLSRTLKLVGGDFFFSPNVMLMIWE